MTVTKEDLQDAHVCVSNRAENFLEKAQPFLFGDYNPMHLIRFGYALKELEEEVNHRKEVQHKFKYQEA